MAKIRVHELAKELKIQSKEVIKFLEEKNIKGKVANSSVEDDVIGMVKSNFTQETKVEKQQNPVVKTEEKEHIQTIETGEHPKKKSSITAVFNPQNSKTVQRRPQGERPVRPTNEQVVRPNRPQTDDTVKPAADQVVRPNRPQTDNTVKPAVNQVIRPNRPQGDNNVRPAGTQMIRPNRPQGDNNVRPSGDQLVRPSRPQGDNNVRPAADQIVRPNRPQTDRPQGARPQGDRPQGDRPQGDRPRTYGDQNRPNRPQGDRPKTYGDRPRTYGDRPQGDRPRTYGDRPQGDRPQGDRPQGDRPRTYGGSRPQGDRPQGDRPRTYGGPRPQGDRPQGDRPRTYGGSRPQGDRPQGDRPQGDRPRTYGASNRPQGDRNNGRTYPSNNNGSRPNSNNRFEHQINKMNQNGSIATSEEARGKESRERDSHNKPVNQRHEKKDIIGKKPERFNNLEKNGKKRRPQQAVQQAPKKEEETIKTITLPEKMTIKELAERMKIQASVIIKKLFLQGTMVTVNSEVTYEAAEEIALEYNCICEQEVKIDVIAELLKEETEDEAAMVKRPPVVCVMGHVDHGKTSLLDAIRDTHVIDREAGGITQHIGAYMVTCNGEKITFLDTPGHEAFTAMRMRGANSTDIAILVVAADDGVMPQTVEAISHAKAAGVEIIVAVNKIDKPSANIERVKQELAEYELIPEDWGGSTIFVPVSAHTNEGIEQLLEMVLLTAEVSELKADPKRNARGLVIEAQLDKGRGSVATVLVQKGTLKVGQPIACGSCYGKVRAMIDDKGKRVKEAGPSTPVEILGLNNVPNAGEIFVCTENEKEAKSFADTFISQGREKMLDETKTRMSLDDLFSQIKSGNVKELPIIVKADVQGSVEAVKQSLVKLSNEEVVVKIIHGGVGAINESDVSLASASNAIIIGFNVRPDATAKATSEREGVDMRLYKVIYNAIEDVQAAMNGMLDPIFEEKILGHAEVRQIFKASVIGNIAGSYVMDGIFQRGCKVRINREGKQIFEGELSSLKRFKDDVKEVRTGYECGLVFDGFNEIQELDMVEAYTMVEVPR